jgi:cyclopropane-fatty-acyl-phospholipid synthase
VGASPPAPPEEIVPHGIRHSIRRDKQAVSHHYDVGNAFYEMVLGSSMSYSCARFVDASTSLEEAQAAKHELICRKLGLDDEVFRSGNRGPRPRLLDVGCGWGSMAIHAATHHDVDVVGVTISDEQAAYARRRVADLGLDDRVEIRIQDYRTVRDGPFDAISSIGMAEHVGHKRMRTYFDTLHDLLRPGGRLLNHAISSVGGARMAERGFIHRYVFPDGELLDVGVTALEMEKAGFEIRDVENLREHYATTLRHWVANLERNWTDAVALVGEGRARVWRLYMCGSINGFDEGRIQLHQTLGVRRHADGHSEMPPTRRYWD